RSHRVRNDLHQQRVSVEPSAFRFGVQEPAHAGVHAEIHLHGRVGQRWAPHSAATDTFGHAADHVSLSRFVTPDTPHLRKFSATYVKSPVGTMTLWDNVGTMRRCGGSPERPSL